MGVARTRALSILTTCPPSNRVPAGEYLTRVRDVARWSEEAGCDGILVYTDHGLVDPWLVSQTIVEATESICPLVAVQPVYMHPYTVAKMVTSIAHLYGRRLYLNFVAGGFRNDLLSFGDTTPHDERYDRLAEYVGIVKQLLEGAGPVSVSGRYYATRDLKLTPPLPPELQPGLMISGTSPAGRRVAREVGAVAMRYPEPAGGGLLTEDGEGTSPSGIRIGIVARDDPDEAWRAAHERFPTDRKGQIAHALATSVSDSQWHHQLSAIDPRPADDHPYWLHPFQNYQTFCPYLVGSYDRVAQEVAGYLHAGVATVILDVPASPEELGHANVVFSQAAALLDNGGPPCVL
jgi:alkanesulfonate monooxygenase